MKECGFCFKEATQLTGEHIFSDWMNKIFTKPWERRFSLPDGRVFAFGAAELNWKEKVVCGDCNSGWMSAIESDHAEPMLTPLIVGQIGIPISEEWSRSIALFAFKTAAVIDLMPEIKKRTSSFFSKRIRTDFRKNLTIPPSVWMWMCAYIPEHYRADVFASAYHTEVPVIGPMQFYIVTYAIGHFVFQVLSLKSIYTGRIRIEAGDTTFNRAAVQFWPKIAPKFVWPRPFAIRSVEELEKFHRRWEQAVSFAG